MLENLKNEIEELSRTESNKNAVIAGIEAFARNHPGSCSRAERELGIRVGTIKNILNTKSVSVDKLLSISEKIIKKIAKADKK
jgi:hypothetical protein